jgi:DNA-binding response OmpR family regulator
MLTEGLSQEAQMTVGTPMPRLLVVDDDPAICQIYREVLGRLNYEVISADSCDQAMAQMSALNGNAEVLVVDLGLPDGDGTDFVRESSRKFGPRPTLFVSGWTDEFWNLSDTPGRWLVMRKPIPIKKLAAAVGWLAHGGEKPAELDAPD